MPTNTFRSSDSALEFDAYYSEEFGSVNRASNTQRDSSFAARQGFHKNRFTSALTINNGALFESSAHLSKDGVPNDANPARNIALRVKQGNAPANINEDEGTIKAFFSRSVIRYSQGLGAGPWTQRIKLSILYAVGTELNRHGLRSFFENLAGFQAILVVPGIEPEQNRFKQRWGFAVSMPTIQRLFDEYFGRPVAIEVQVLAAFSTGINGLNQTLLNELVPLGAVRRLIVFDCLYVKSSGSTADAIRLLKSRAGSSLRIVVYKTSEGMLPGSNQPGANDIEPDQTTLTVVKNNPGLIDRRGLIENLYQKDPYQCLILFRSLEAGVRDGVCALPARAQAAFEAMRGIVPPRGTMVSNDTCRRYVFGDSAPSAGLTSYEDWANRPQNRAVFKNFEKGHPNAVGSIRNLVWANMLPGWPGGLGAEKHDLLIPEFGWEYLPAD